MSTQYQLLIREEGSSGPICRYTYDGEEWLDVRELSSRTTLTVRAQEISLYRHTLFLDGKAYLILDVVRQQ